MAHGQPDFQGGKYGLLTEAELAEREGYRVTIPVSGPNIAPGGFITTNHTPVAPLTLYITDITATIIATAVADRDNNQICHLDVRTPGALDLHVFAGGNGGIVCPLAKPIKVEGGDTIWLILYNFSNHNCDLFLTARGYEI